MDFKHWRNLHSFRYEHKKQTCFLFFQDQQLSVFIWSQHFESFGLLFVGWPAANPIQQCARVCVWVCACPCLCVYMHVVLHLFITHYFCTTFKHVISFGFDTPKTVPTHTCTCTRVDEVKYISLFWPRATQDAKCAISDQHTFFCTQSCQISVIGNRITDITSDTNLLLQSLSVCVCVCAHLFVQGLVFYYQSWNTNMPPICWLLQINEKGQWYLDIWKLMFCTK